MPPEHTRAAVISRSDQGERIAADGGSFASHDWRGSGPPALHVHHADDEAWHILEGRLRFRFADGSTDAGPGTTVFVPKGVAHTYEAIEPSRYLIILTPRLRDLIASLQTAPAADHPEIYRNHHSELV
jgi:mannose-6-phosphate isomerase-like protein (cupin superfamily)